MPANCGKSRQIPACLMTAVRRGRQYTRSAPGTAGRGDPSGRLSRFRLDHSLGRSPTFSQVAATPGQLSDQGSWRYLWCGLRETAVSQDPFIACIDDDKSVRDAIEGFLKAFGFAVEAFSSAEDFLQSSRLNQTSCLIADVKLPGMSGLQLQHWLTASGQRVPTIFIRHFRTRTAVRRPRGRGDLLSRKTHHQGRFA